MIEHVEDIQDFRDQGCLLKESHTQKYGLKMAP